MAGRGGVFFSPASTLDYALRRVRMLADPRPSGWVRMAVWPCARWFDRSALDREPADDPVDAADARIRSSSNRSKDSNEELTPTLALLYFRLQPNVRVLPALIVNGCVAHAKFECSWPIGVVDKGFVAPPAVVSKFDSAQLSKPVVP